MLELNTSQEMYLNKLSFKWQVQISICSICLSSPAAIFFLFKKKIKPEEKMKTAPQQLELFECNQQNHLLRTHTTPFLFRRVKMRSFSKSWRLGINQTNYMNYDELPVPVDEGNRRVALPRFALALMEVICYYREKNFLKILNLGKLFCKYCNISSACIIKS